MQYADYKHSPPLHSSEFFYVYAKYSIDSFLTLHAKQAHSYKTFDALNDKIQTTQ